MEDKIRISEIAKKYSISRSALIYYDNIGLLTPHHDDITGYRYYSIGDMEKLEMILTLKETGVPLKIIKIFLKNPSHKESILLLKKQREIVQNKILEFQNLEILLNKRIYDFEQYENIEFYEGIRLNYYESKLFYVEAIDYSKENSLEIAIKSLKTKLNNSIENYGTITSKYGLILSGNSILNGDYENYSYVFDYLSNSVDDVKSLTSSTGHYICSLHQGTMKNIGNTIRKMMDYIEVNQYRIVGDCYIIPLIDSWATPNEEEYISEILIPITLEK